MTVRKPQALKKLQGTAQPCRIIAGLASTDGVPDMPDGLSDKAVEVWEDLAPRLIVLGLLGEIDASTFGSYCQSYADWLEMTEYLNKLGISNWYWTTENGYRQVIPEVSERNKAFSQMQKLAPKFGLDPSSRSGIDTGNATDANDPVEEFLFQGKKRAEG